jgi:uncharacterized protein YkwD
MEALEPRCLLSAVYPSAYEQYLVELINQARADPAAVAASFHIDLNEGLGAGTISPDAKQPLAINPDLTDGARGHSAWMLDTDVFQHEGPGTATPGDRMTWAGYDFVRPWSWGENIAWRGNTRKLPDFTQGTAQLNQDLFVDQGIDDRGHRINMLDPGYKEVGTGVIAGVFTQDGADYQSLMATEDFASTAGNPFLTGVAYNDAVAKDQFYTPGEGLGGVTITAQRLSDQAVFTTQTWDSGGYSLQLAPGTYRVTAAGSGLSGSVGYANVVIGNQNVKRDFTPATPPTPPADFTPPTASLDAPAQVTVAGPTDYTFTVSYSDNVAIDPAGIGNANLIITGPDDFAAGVSLVGVTPADDGKTLQALYRVGAPGGSWDPGDNGTYKIHLANSQVADTSGQFVPGGTLGAFGVQIDSPTTGGDVSPGDSPAPLLESNTIVAGAEAGGPPVVQGFNPGNDSQRFRMLAFDGNFTGGVRVATGDVTGDGTPDLIVAPGPGAGPNVRVFDGRSGQQINGPLGSFYAYDPGFDGGVFVASGDVNGDGRADLITGTSNGPANVKVFSGADGTLLASFFAYDPASLSGVRVAAGDISGDGRPDLLTAPGPGSPATVKLFDAPTFHLDRSINAYDGYDGGVYLASGDTNGDGHADIITAAQSVPHVKVFSGADNTLLASFFAYPGFQGGVRVGSADVDGDGRADLLTAVGPGAGPHVKAFSGGHQFTMVQSFFANDPASDPNGLYIA